MNVIVIWFDKRWQHQEITRRSRTPWLRLILQYNIWKYWENSNYNQWRIQGVGGGDRVSKLISKSALLIFNLFSTIKAKYIRLFHFLLHKNSELKLLSEELYKRFIIYMYNKCLKLYIKYSLENFPITKIKIISCE